MTKNSLIQVLKMQKNKDIKPLASYIIIWTKNRFTTE